MRSTIFCGVTLALLATAAGDARATFALNPQAGLNVSRLSTDPENFEQSARVGYQFGGFLRSGERTYLQPGVFWIRSGTELEGRDEVTTDLVKDATDLQGLCLPVQLGYDLVRGDGFALRGNLGASATLVTSVADNPFGLEKDDFESVIWGGRVGLGLDLTRLTADLVFDAGLSNVFKADTDARNNVISLTVGLLFY